MSYVIQAILGDPLALTRTSLGAVPIVRLPQNLGMLPLTDELRGPLDLAFCPLTDGETLGAAVIDLLASVSAGGRAAYVEVEMFGGAGDQACLLAERGVAHSEPTVIFGAVNEALRFLGVDKGQAEDEFAAVDLGRYRWTEHWVRDADPPPPG